MTETLTELEQLQAEFDRFRRRARRDARKAQADGLLMGVVSMLTPRDVVCDCGANVGDVTAQLAASGAHFHAFDPDPYCIDTLKKRFADAPNVTIHEAMEAAGLFDKIRLTVAETHENKFKELRPRFRALRERLSEAYPITRVNLDWI